MAFEKKWAAVSPQAFTANGTGFGAVTVADTAGFRVKQSAYLKNTAGTTLPVQIKRVISSTKLIVGLVDNNIASWKPLDISTWTVVSGAAIGAEEQDKQANPPDKDHYHAIYEADPVVADRVIFVDQYGNFYDDANPLPTSATFTGTITIGDVQVKGPSGFYLDPNSDGSVKTVQLFTLPFDTITATYPSATQEVYKSRTGGVGGVVQQTITVDYTDSTKNLITSVVRT